MPPFYTCWLRGSIVAGPGLTALLGYQFHHSHWLAERSMPEYLSIGVVLAIVMGVVANHIPRGLVWIAECGSKKIREPSNRVLAAQVPAVATVYDEKENRKKKRKGVKQALQAGTANKAGKRTRKRRGGNTWLPAWV